MRYSILLMIVLAMNSILNAAETSVKLERCIAISDAANKNGEGAVALYFTIPKVVSEHDIIHAELNFASPVKSLNDGSLCEFILYPAVGEWSATDIDYDAAMKLRDNLIISSYTVKLNDKNEFHVDITEFVKGLIEKERINYGLIGMIDFLGKSNDFQLSVEQGDTSMSNAEVRIVYK